MFDNTPSDKVQFRALGELREPGACLICGSGSREEGYVDLGVFIDYHGTCYLCVTCVIQVGEVINMLTPDEVRLVNQQNSDLLTENAALKATVEEDNERLKAYALILSGTGVGPYSGTGDPEPYISEAYEEFDERADGGESEAAESDSGDGGPGSIRETEQDNGSGEDTTEPAPAEAGEPELFRL